MIVIGIKEMYYILNQIVKIAMIKLKSIIISKIKESVKLHQA